MRDLGWVTGRRVAGAALLGAMVAFALLWPLLAPDVVTESGYLSADQSPSWAHPLGTDGLGHDLSVRVAAALRVSLAVSAGAALLAAVLGAAAGATAAAAGGRVDAVVMRLTDATAAVPHLLATVVVVALFRGSLTAIVVALALTHWPPVARVVRAEAQKVMASGYVAASRVAGASRMQLVGWHVLPAVAGQVGIAVVLMVPHAVWHESTLSFLGIGMPPERPSLGTLIALSQPDLLLGRWWPLVFPTVALVLVTVAVALLGADDSRGRGGRGTQLPCRAGVIRLAAGDGDRDGGGLSVHDLTVTHHGPCGEVVTAVDGFCLRVTPGRVVALVGPSGAGKSSVLDVCAGVVSPEATVSGRVGIGVSRDDDEAFPRSAVGHVPQNAAAAFTPTRHVRGLLAESLAASRRPAGRRAGRRGASASRVSDADRHAGVDALCRLVDVDPTLTDRYPHQLSGGQLRRLALAAALGTRPVVLLADEPTTGLDPELTREVLTLLRGLADRQRIAVLVVTHDVDALAANGVADEIVEMRAGALVSAESELSSVKPVRTELVS